MIIEWDPRDDIFVVTVPELPGCRTHGATYEEAIRQGQDAIQSWLNGADDGDEPPRPRFFDDDRWTWPELDPRIIITLFGDDEEDAKWYQERQVCDALEALRMRREIGDELLA